MSTEISYEIINILYRILVPNSWIRYLTIPLIFTFSFFFLTKYKKHYSFFEKIGFTFIFYIVSTVMMSSLHAYLEGIITKNKLIKLLQNQEFGTKVYINDIEIVNSKRVIDNLKKIRYYHQPKFRDERPVFLYISINEGQKAIRFKLYKDIHFKYKYWIYRLNKERSSTYIGWTCLLSPNIKHKRQTPCK